MRDLQDCKAEVFRRSEQRIRKRKQARKRVLIGGVLLVLCATVWSAATLPTMLTVQKEAASEADTVVTDDTGDTSSSVCSYTEAQIRTASELSEHGERTVTDPTDVARLFGAIQDLCAASDGASPEIGQATEDGAEDSASSLTADSSREPDCSVTFSTAEGTAVTYTLTGRALANESTGQIAMLSEEQLIAFKELLGLL